MKSRTFFVILSTLCAAPALGISSADGDPNRLLVEATKLVESAERTSSEADERDLYRRAKTKLLQIVTNFPASAIAAKIATGRSVGTVSLERIDEGLRTAGPCEDSPSTHLTYDCLLEKARATGDRAIALKDSAFDDRKRWKLEAELAIADASAGEFSSASKRLDTLEALLPIGERHGTWSRSWSYLDALGPVACKLAGAGYDTESHALLRKGISVAQHLHSPGSSLRSLAGAQACAGHFGDAVDTAAQIFTAGGSGVSDGKALQVLTIAEIAETALDNGMTDRAAAVLDELPGDAAPDNLDSIAYGSEARSAVVRVLARLGESRARQGDVRATSTAFERALDTAGDGKRPWSEIGGAAIWNRASISPTAGPSWRARDAVGDLVAIATSMHAAGMREEAARTLADAERAAGGEPGPLAEIATARFRLGDRSSANEALAWAEKASAVHARELFQPVFMSFSSELPGPRCGQDHEWSDQAKAFNLGADQEDSRLPPCTNGPAFTERVNLAAAYLAQGDQIGVEAALSCDPPLQITPGDWDDQHPATMKAALMAEAGLADRDGLNLTMIVPPAAEAGHEFATGSGICTGEASDLVDRCRKLIGDDCAYFYTNWTIGMELSKPKPDYPDALRAKLAWRLAREKDFDKAVHVASGIVNPDRRAESLTELALLQVKLGMVRFVRATLVRAVAAAEEIPEDFPDAPTLFSLVPHDTVNVQDRAIRFARIAQVLGELLPHE